VILDLKHLYERSILKQSENNARVLIRRNEKPFPCNVCDNFIERSNSVRSCVCPRVLRRDASFNEIFVARHVIRKLVFRWKLRWTTISRIESILLTVTRGDTSANAHRRNTFTTLNLCTS